MARSEDEQFEPRWRPRSSDVDRPSGFDRQQLPEGDSDERWRSRDYYEQQRSEGYNPIGSDYLRDVGITPSSGRGEYVTAQHTAREPWRREHADGPHVGRGPRGYVRSDARIHEEVCERLMRHGRIDATDIDVRVENGEVTLEGEVDSRRTKRLAEEILDDVVGIRDVANRLRVRQ